MYDASALNLRVGVDLGGTKIEAVVMAADSRVVARLRVPTPAGDYAATVCAIADLVTRLEVQVQQTGLPVGICTPGALDPATGLLKNANSTCLNGQSLQKDLERALSRPLRLANDADCLAVSEAADGAAAGAASVFAVILGTGVGGGIVSHGRLLRGPNAITGEWGHNPLPWPDPHKELPGPKCWCGRSGCIETWLSGPGLAADYERCGGNEIDASGIGRRAQQGETLANSVVGAYEHRLARALASVINILDPEVIVLGGGVSLMQRLYERVPVLWAEYVFCAPVATRLLPAKHGDASGVSGAARLNDSDGE